VQKKIFKGRCEKRRLRKSSEVCRFYSDIQSAYGDILDAEETIAEIFCNQPMMDWSWGILPRISYARKQTMILWLGNVCNGNSSPNR
jgi:hypothetical protein